ncbi:helix-turn-helix domain-containing protein [Vasconcelosia minhoensis]|nr:helix-turn-helix domain-containing protein [Romeria gracilis]
MSISVGTRLDPIAIRQGLALSQERLGALLRVSPKTVSRWERAERRPTDEALLRKMAKLQEIVDLGSRVYQPDGLREFLSTPLPLFGGRSGLDLIGLGEFEPVIAALAADFEGTGF